MIYNRCDLEKKVKSEQAMSKRLEHDRVVQVQARKLIVSLKRENDDLRRKMVTMQAMERRCEQEVEAEEEHVDKSLSQILRETDPKGVVEVNEGIIVKDAVEEAPKVMKNEETQTVRNLYAVARACQSELSLASAKYNSVLSQEEIENAVKEQQIKEQINCLEELSQASESSQRMQKLDKNSLVRILDGLPGSFSEIKQMGKADMFDLFLRNVNQIKTIIDKDEDQDSDRNNSSSGYDTNRKKSKSMISSVVDESDQESDLSIRNTQHLQIPAQKGQRRSSRGHQEEHKREIKIAIPEDHEPIKIIRMQDQAVQVSIDKAPQPQTKSHRTAILMQAAFNKEQQKHIKSQVTMLMCMYNLQTQKVHNLQKVIEDQVELLKNTSSHYRQQMIHLLKTQRISHKQDVDAFQKQFEALSKRLPGQLVRPISEEEFKVITPQEEEILEKKKQQSEKLKSNIRKTRRITKALEFNFSLKKNKEVDKSSNPGQLLVSKVKEQYQSLTKNTNFLPIRNLLKMVSQVYEERIKSIKANTAEKELEMGLFTFNIFLNRFGFKNVAEKKFVQFLMSCLHFNQVFRVNVFARVVGVLQDEGLNFSNDESAFLIQGLDYMLNESTLGVQVLHNDSDAKCYVPYVRVLDYMKVFLENLMTEEELRDLKNELEQVKENDPKGHNKSGVVDVDIFLVMVMQRYRIITNRTKAYVIHAFQAADLDDNKKINPNEFITLYRYIESDKFELDHALETFDEAADMLEDDQKCLSFDKFTAVCVNHNLFSLQAQNRFLEVEGAEQVRERMSSVKEQWPAYKADIQAKLKELGPFVKAQTLTEWEDILAILERRVGEEKNEMKPLLIAHKILALELQRLIDIDQEQEEEQEEDQEA